MNLPNNLKYTKDYSWVSYENKVAIIGIIEPAVKKVDEFVFIMLPKAGDKIKKGDKYVSLEAVKWTGHLTSPVSGKIIDVNNSLFDEPSKINEDPYGSWIMKVQLDDEKELDDLLDCKKIEKEIEK